MHENEDLPDLGIVHPSKEAGLVEFGLTFEAKWPSILEEWFFLLFNEVSQLILYILTIHVQH